MARLGNQCQSRARPGARREVGGSLVFAVVIVYAPYVYIETVVYVIDVIRLNHATNIISPSTS